MIIHQLLATVVGASVNPQTKALSEGFLSGPILINMGADTLAGEGIASAVSAAKVGLAREGFGLTGFGAMGGGNLRYNRLTCRCKRFFSFGRIVHW
jgi:hypothetical protein